MLNMSTADPSVTDVLKTAALQLIMNRIGHFEHILFVHLFICFVSGKESHAAVQCGG